MGPFFSPQAVPVPGYVVHRLGTMTLEEVKALWLRDEKEMNISDQDVLRCPDSIQLYIENPQCQYTKTPIAFFGIECDSRFYRKSEPRVWTLRPYAKIGDTEVLLTKDHIIPRALGGPDTLVNYQPLLDFVNEAKGARLYKQDIELAKERGLLTDTFNARIGKHLQDITPWTIAELSKLKGQSELKSMGLSIARLRKNSKKLRHPLPIGSEVIRCTMKRFRSGKYTGIITAVVPLPNNRYRYQFDNTEYSLDCLDCHPAPSENFKPYVHPAEHLLDS